MQVALRLLADRRDDRAPACGRRSACRCRRRSRCTRARRRRSSRAPWACSTKIGARRDAARRRSARAPPAAPRSGSPARWLDGHGDSSLRGRGACRASEHIATVAADTPPWTVVPPLDRIRRICPRGIGQLLRWSRSQEEARVSSTRRDAAAGAGAPPPLAALHGDARPAAGAAADHRRAARGRTCSTSTAGATSTCSPGSSPCRSATRYGEELGEVAAEQARRAAVLHELDVRAPAGDRARREARRARRRRTSTAPSSSRAAPRRSRPRGSSPASTTRTGPADAAQGDRAQDRLPRHDDRRALDHRHHRASARRSSR